ncbi:MAG: amidohydrolase family protein, partial [Deinococcus sp.]
MHLVSPAHLSGQLLLPNGEFRAGKLSFGSHLLSVTPEDVAGEVFVLPGFIDTHVHGGGGGDTMDGAEGIRMLARLHARHGTTSCLPTTITNPWENVLAALVGVREVMDSGGADVIGAHLEGPFINPGRMGAQPPNAVDPTPDLVAEVLETGVVRAVTLAPELPGATEA